MKSPVCFSNICVTNRKQTASFSIAGLLLAIAPLWLMLAAAGTSVQAQTTPSSADWTQFHRDNMQRWNPYETVLGVNNVGSLQLKWKNPIGGNYDYDSGYPGSSPAVANGVVYVGSTGGNLYALNASTGATLWSSTAGFWNPSPAIVDGVLYTVAGDVPSCPGLSPPGSNNCSGIARIYAFSLPSAASADLFLRIQPTPEIVQQGDLITYTFPVWNLGPGDAVHEVLNTQVPGGHNPRLRPHLRHAGAGHLHHSALRGNWRNRVPRKQCHGAEHHMDSAPDCEGNGTVRDSYYRERNDHRGYAGSQPRQQHCDGEHDGAVTRRRKTDRKRFGKRKKTRLGVCTKSKILPVGRPNRNADVRTARSPEASTQPPPSA